MSLNVIKKPKALHPVYSDENDFIFYDSVASGGIDWIYTGTIIKQTTLISSSHSSASNIYYKIIININGEKKISKIYADLRGIGRFNPRYILENYIKSKLIDSKMLVSFMNEGILIYTATIQYYKSGALVSTESLGTFKCYNGTSQMYNSLDVSDYSPTSGKPAKWLNKYEGGIYINKNDNLTLQGFTGISGVETNGYEQLMSITIKEFYIDKNDGKIKNKSATRSVVVPSNLEITSINISPSVWGMGDDIIYYEVHSSNNSFEVVKVYIEKPNMIVKRRYRLSYINSNGATDYINFTASDTEQLKIKRNEFIDVNNQRNVYKTESNSIITVRSRYMSELSGFDLKDLWVSPKVNVEVFDNLTNNTLYKYDVILNNNSVNVLRDHELISYKVSFSYLQEQNIQR